MEELNWLQITSLISAFGATIIVGGGLLWFFWRINKDAQEAFAEQNAAKTN